MFRKVNLIAYFVICLKFSYALNWFNFGATGTKSRGCSVEDSTLVAKYFHKVKYDKSNCPTETWLSDFHLVDSNPSKLIIDVGYVFLLYERICNGNFHFIFSIVLICACLLE